MRKFYAESTLSNTCSFENVSIQKYSLNTSRPNWTVSPTPTCSGCNAKIEHHLLCCLPIRKLSSATCYLLRIGELLEVVLSRRNTTPYFLTRSCIDSSFCFGESSVHRPRPIVPLGSDSQSHLRTSHSAEDTYLTSETT